MSDLIVPNIICFHTQKQLTTLNKVGHYLKVFWVIYMHVISRMHKPLYMHVACILITVHAICQALCLSVNFLWCQKFTFYCRLKKKRCTLLAEGTDRHIQQHNHQKDLNPSVTILLWQGHCWIGKNTNKEFNCVYGTCDLTK